jgi:transposase
MKKQPARFVGIDVSKDQLDIACRPEDTRWRVANDSSGIAELIIQLRQLKPALIVLEATGGWQYTLVAALAVSTLPFAVMNPRQIRDFAKATGQLAKTDALDAGVIAHFAEAVRPMPRPLPDEMTQQIDRCCSAGANCSRCWSPSAIAWRWHTQRSVTALHSILTISSA